MSTYFYIEGELFFDTEEKMLEAISPLEEGGWLVSDIIFAESGFRASDETPHLDREKLKLTLPASSYRNIGRAMDRVLPFANEKSSYSESSQDGCEYISFYSFKDKKFIGVEGDDIADYLKNPEDKDLFLLGTEDFIEKYPDYSEDDYYENRNELFFIAEETFYKAKKEVKENA